MSVPAGPASIIDQIGELEGARDPKCHATASRLEDLIYGTPLTAEARFAKNDLREKARDRDLAGGLGERAAQELAEVPGEVAARKRGSAS